MVFEDGSVHGHCLNLLQRRVESVATCRRVSGTRHLVVPGAELGHAHARQRRAPLADQRAHELHDARVLGAGRGAEPGGQRAGGAGRGGGLVVGACVCLDLGDSGAGEGVLLVHPAAGVRQVQAASIPQPHQGVPGQQRG